MVFHILKVAVPLLGGEGDFLRGQVTAELGKHGGCDLEFLGDRLVLGQVPLAEIEEDILVEEPAAERVRFGRGHLHVGVDSPASVDAAAAVGEANLLARRHEVPAV